MEDRRNYARVDRRCSYGSGVITKIEVGTEKKGGSWNRGLGYIPMVITGERLWD